MNNPLINSIQTTANEIAFSGVISIKHHDISYQNAFGYRDRANKLENTIDTRFGIASGTKGFTALAIAALINSGQLDLETTAHSILSPRLNNLNPQITIRQLLSHTSGVGDYYDEEEITDADNFILAIPVQNLVSPLDYIPLQEPKPQKFPPGQRAAYSNGGYILLAMIIEILAEMPYQQFVEQTVFKKADMNHSSFFRSDALPHNTALGYTSEENPLKTNIFNLPIIGGGDGGAYSTLADMDQFWLNLKAGNILPKQTLEPYLKSHNQIENSGYGYGFWIPNHRDHLTLVGHDAGVSFYSTISITTNDGFTIISNTSSNAWPIAKLLKAEFEDNHK